MSYGQLAQYRRRGVVGTGLAALGYLENNYPTQTAGVREYLRTRAGRAWSSARDYIAQSAQDRARRVRSNRTFHRAQEVSNRRLNASVMPSQYSSRSRRMRANARHSRYSHRKRIVRKRGVKRASKTSSRSTTGAYRSSSGFMGTLWRSLCAPQTYKETIAWSREGIQGQRQWASLALGGYTMVNQVIATRRPSNFLFNTAGGVTSTATLQDIGQNDWRAKITNLLFDARIQNRSNASMELKIYHCVVRHDVSSLNMGLSLTAAWQAMFERNTDNQATNIGSGLNNLGPNQEAAPTGYTHNWQHPSFTPYLSNEFVQYFKVLKTESLRLGPNEIVSRVFKMRPKVLKGAQIVSPNSTEWQRGWSKMILFSWVGMPVDDDTVNNQSKAACDLFVQYDSTLKWFYMPGASPLVNFGYGNSDINNLTSAYRLNPATFTPQIPATGIVQVPASAGEDVPAHHP